MSLGALQTAIYKRLIGDAALMAIVKLVATQGDQSDDGATSTPFPYITIGGDTSTPRDTKTSLGKSVIALIDIWSRTNNFLEVKEIGQLVIDLLHQRPMIVIGGQHVMTVHLTETYSIDPDGVTKRGLLMFGIAL